MKKSIISNQIIKENEREDIIKILLDNNKEYKETLLDSENKLYNFEIKFYKNNKDEKLYNILSDKLMKLRSDI